MSASNAARNDQGQGASGSSGDDQKLRVVPPPGAVAASGRPGGFWRRVPAVAIDALLLFAVEKVLFILIGINGDLKPINSDGSLMMPLDLLHLPSEKVRAFLLSFAIGATLNVVYCFLFYRSKGATIGKLALGLEVVDFESGEKIGLGQTILREFFGKWISKATFGIGYLVAAFRLDKRALHDFVGSTQVRIRK